MLSLQPEDNISIKLYKIQIIFMALFFTVGTIFGATTHSCCLDFPAMMDYTLEPQANINSSLLKKIMTPNFYLEY